MNNNQITLSNSFENNNSNSLDERISNYSGRQPFDRIIQPHQSNSENYEATLFVPGKKQSKGKIEEFKTNVLQFLIDRKADQHNKKEIKYQDNNMFQL